MTVHRFATLASPALRAYRATAALHARRGTARSCGGLTAEDSLRRQCVEQLALVVRSPETLKAVLQDCTPEARVQLATAAIQTHRLEVQEIEGLVNSLSNTSLRALTLAAMARHFGVDFREEFEKADADKSGTISKIEFRRYLTSVAPQLEGGADEPTARQLFLYGFNAAIPMMVFGCLDNSIMIVGGDVVDDLIGSTFKLSTLACAALANTFADVFGISIGNTVERVTGRLGMPKAQLTQRQAELPLVRRVGMVGASMGILCGCLLGMTPLLFMDEDKKVWKDAFSRMDLDGDGCIDAAELKHAFVVAGLMLEDHIVEKVITDCDLSKGGRIALEDFMMNFSKIKSIVQTK